MIERPKKERKSIPSPIRTKVFERDCENKHKILCPVCNINEITEKSCNCGHIISWINGGSDDISNLVSICKQCNDDMHDMNMDEFMFKNYPTRRMELENDIKIYENWINEANQKINENKEELKTLPIDPKIWSIVKNARKIYELNNIHEDIKNISNYNNHESNNVTEFIEKTKLNRGEARNPIVKYTLNNIEYLPKDGEKITYLSFLLNICNIIAKEQGNNFERVLTANFNKDKNKFNKNKSNLRYPKPIIDTDIFVETNWNSEYTKNLVKDMLEFFGYKKDSLLITYKFSNDKKSLFE